MSDEKCPTTERLALALESAGAPKPMVDKARNGWYDNFKSPLDTPIRQLVADAYESGLADIARRAIDGEFDSTREESDEWARSAEARAIFRTMT